MRNGAPAVNKWRLWPPFLEAAERVDGHGENPRDFLGPLARPE
jgi:hypothetical protein